LSENEVPFTSADVDEKCQEDTNDEIVTSTEQNDSLSDFKMATATKSEPSNDAIKLQGICFKDVRLF
jgi:hypothetical protein